MSVLDELGARMNDSSKAAVAYKLQRIDVCDEEGKAFCKTRVELRAQVGEANSHKVLFAQIVVHPVDRASRGITEEWPGKNVVLFFHEHTVLKRKMTDGELLAFQTAHLQLKTHH